MPQSPRYIASQRLVPIFSFTIGRVKRISKRRGDVVFLRELVERIGVDAARWYLVSRGHDQPIDIDVDLAAERS